MIRDICIYHIRRRFSTLHDISAAMSDEFAQSPSRKRQRWRERLDLLISPSRCTYMYVSRLITVWMRNARARAQSHLIHNAWKHTFTHAYAYIYVHVRIATGTYRRDNRRGRADALVSEYLGYLPLSPSRRRESRALITLTKFSHFPLNVPFVLMNDLSSYLLSPCARSPESSFRGVGLAR